MPIITPEYNLYNWSDLNFPTIEPSLRLDFANARALDPRITFTRASTATYVGSDGLIKTVGEDEARFDHDPATGESLGLLIEETRTNYFAYSESTAWESYNGGQTSLENSTLGILSPAGSTPLVIRPTNTSLTSLLSDRYQLYPSSGGTMIFSVFVKTPPGSQYEEVQLQASAVNAGNFTASLIFNISTLTTRGTVGTAANAGIFDYGNGWYRICMSFTCPASTSGPIQRVSIVDDSVAQGTNQSDGLLTFGYQLELGPFPTSYIPTSGSTATRAVDLPYIEGTSFSSWYNPEGGAYVLDVIADSDSGQFFGFGTSSYLESFNVSNSAGTQFYISGNYNTSNAYTGNMNLNQSNKIGVSFNSTGQRVCSNGQSVNGSSFSSGATSLFTDFDRASFGGNIPWDKNYTNQKRTHVKSFSYYPKYLSDAQLQTLTQ